MDSLAILAISKVQASINWEDGVPGYLAMGCAIEDRQSFRFAAYRWNQPELTDPELRACMVEHPEFLSCLETAYSCLNSMLCFAYCGKAFVTLKLRNLTPMVAGISCFAGVKSLRCCKDSL